MNREHHQPIDAHCCRELARELQRREIVRLLDALGDWVVRQSRTLATAVHDWMQRRRPAHGEQGPAL